MSHMLGRKRSNEEYRSQQNSYDYTDLDSSAINNDHDSNIRENSRHHRNPTDYYREKRSSHDSRYDYRRGQNNFNTRPQYYTSKRYDSLGEKDRSYKPEMRKEGHPLRTHNNYGYNEKRSHHHRDEVNSREERFYVGGDRKKESIRKESISSVENDRTKQRASILRKNTSFLIILPKNYLRFLNEEYEKIYKDIKQNIRDIRSFNHEYTVSGFKEGVLKIDAGSVSSKAQALKIFSDYIYKYQKSIYTNLTYIKMSILVPYHVVGFVIGIDGKNINKIRDLTDAKVDVKAEDIGGKYRQIELAGKFQIDTGKSVQISRAAERIYRIVNKYYLHGGRERSQILTKPRLKLRKTEDSRKRNGNKKDNSESKEKIDDNRHNHSYRQRKMFKRKDINDYRQKSTSSEKKEGYYSRHHGESPINRGREIQPIPNEKGKLEIVDYDNVSKIYRNDVLEESITISEAINNKQVELPIEKKDDLKNVKVKLHVMVSNKFINKNPQYLKELERLHNIEISFKTEQLLNNFSKIDNDILTFYGLPEQNSKALLSLQQDLLHFEINPSQINNEKA